MCRRLDLMLVVFLALSFPAMGVAAEEDLLTATVEFAGDAVQHVAFAAGDARVVTSQFDDGVRDDGVVEVKGGSRRIGGGPWVFYGYGALASSTLGEKRTRWAVDMNVVLDPWQETVVAVPPGIRPIEGAPQQAHRLRYGLGISPDGKTVATGSYAQPVVRLWDAGTGNHARYLAYGKPIPHVFRAIEHPTFSPDGKSIVAFCHHFRADSTRAFVRQWSLIVWDIKTGKVKKSLDWADKDKGVWQPECVAWTPDGKQIVAASKDGIHVWDVALKPNHVREIACNGKFDFAIAMLDRQPAVECVTVSRNDTAIEIDTWDLVEGKIGRSVPIEESLYERIAKVSLYNAAAVSHDGGRVALPLVEGDIALVDASSGKIIVSLPAKHRKDVSSLAFSSDDKQLASAGTKETAVKIWKLPE
ncbi:MAG: WD40 repeat domain-containing protein [Pirellulales bacterium]